MRVLVLVVSFLLSRIAEPQLYGQAASLPAVCYIAEYDSIERGVERAALPHSLKLLLGIGRAALTTEDTSAVWQYVSTVSHWRRRGDSLDLMLSNGQFELWMALVQLADTLEGWAVYATDVHVQHRPRAHLRAVQSQCRRP